RRSDIPNPVTREFCGECGTHLTTRTQALPGAALIKVGTLDDPSVFGAPQMVIFTIDKQTFISSPRGCPPSNATRAEHLPRLRPAPAAAGPRFTRRPEPCYDLA